MTAGPRALSGRLLRSGHLFARLVRFGCVGIASGGLYACVTALLVGGLGVPPVPASVGGYCASVPLSFLGHRGFSFRSNGRWSAEALRFAVAQALNIAVTAAAMNGAVSVLGLSYVWGMAAAVVLVPIANFLLMNLWVFRDKQGREVIAIR